MPKRIYSDTQLKEAVASSYSIAGVLRSLGVYYRSGSGYSSVKRQIKERCLDTSHFTGQSTSGRQSRKTPDQIFTCDPKAKHRRSATQLRRALLESGAPHVCSVCFQEPLWNGEPLTLQVDHLNGDWRDCRHENLRFICPNCHSQAPTSIRSKNIHKCHTVTCKGCGVSRVMKTTQNPTYCKPCQALKASQISASVRADKWPTPVDLKTAIWASPVSAVAKTLGVSGTAVKKKCQSLGIETPPRGYWSKKNAG